ncbi:BTAD domain-containing putative transcriptional regulator [Bailinhaonella thermotolerans]|uniref:AfsR/SARP family transcriptional regulator n=1 Tax=Bailinhaonella thermotolerans TaxID=1070861 RepID=A0A3A4AS51_9ACTN|nr:BTAD domain-containing putative transcriptional regulator [Bailinhaonella thermotolerans]RJL30124.1 AfsR/SARP family transcriptional regulator [Bailinhaonella thermotolerans]
MRFGVLGPLAVWTSDGGPVRIPEVKVRALLAELLVGAGRVVPADRLIDDLWGERLPANPAGALQTRISQLRRALDEAEPGARALVVSRPPGYLLDVRPGDVDAGRFQELLARVGAAAGPRERAALLADALALWRGPALLDFADEEFARPEAARLGELRLTALEEQAEARLELGEHALLADELGDLVARHPLRERLRAAHLRALYRAGRQSEALDGYRDLRERLADELGVDPGRKLAELHSAILRQDPALGAPSAPAPAVRLPVPLGDLVGREAEAGEVERLLTAGRLVTLTGPGGVGKTRLALEAARRSAAAFPDGVWLAELGALPAGALPGEVAELVAATVGVRDEAPTALADRLPELLRERRALLVLDNCEHVLASAARLTASLLRAAPGLRVLATSQMPLNVSGEALFAVPPLEEAEAVRLFAERAAARTPGFTLDEENAEAVASICRRLDGIPLALELAATRVRALGVRELAERLDDRFRLLAAGPQDAPERQRTLRAMIDWSWEPLSEAERAVLRRLAVHADGCTLRAAEEVCGEEGLDVLDLLAGLVDRSLVAVAEVGGVTRYRLLESVAAYCRERLREAGELAEIERRHARHYAGLAAAADAHLRGSAQGEWLRRLDAETANLHVALAHAVRHGGAARLANTLAWYWVLRGRLGEGRRWFAAATGAAEDPAQDPAEAEEVATARLWDAAFGLRTGEPPAPERLTPPADRPRDLAALGRRARAEWYLSFARIGIGIGEPPGDDATLPVFRSLGDDWGVAASLSLHARRAQLRGDLAAVREYGERGMALFSELGDRWGRHHATYALGWHAEVTGDYEKAARVHREGLRMAEELDLRTEMADKLSELGRVALLQRDYAQADDLHGRARRQAEEQGYTVGVEFAELGLALSYRRQGRIAEGEAVLRGWLDWDHRLESDVALALIYAELGFAAEQRGDAGDARALHERGLGAARRTGDPRALALAYEGLAGTHALEGDPAGAARLLGSAARLRESAGAPLPEAERFDVDRVTAAAVSALGPDVFAARFAEGHTDPELSPAPLPSA